MIGHTIVLLSSMEVTPAKEVERETAGEIERLGIQGQGKREWEEKQFGHKN